MSANSRSSSATRSSQPRLRCAVYTRKSTEEGLDQEFNSLDAQYEACAAFIASQVGLGWKLSPERYDDGGISGGTMERPALQRLLLDIRDRKIDVVVVYKIDRLTRSLMDFSRIVEIFDVNTVSFVSVTQQFNTTTSMGRLTLNVLLSFAQFEREVTAERIRDKIAASRKKGMWMGGTVPTGYRVQDRKLVVSEPKASFVRSLFRRYLELKSTPKLAAEVSRASSEAGEPTRHSHRDSDCVNRDNDRCLTSSKPELACEHYHLRPMSPGMLGKLLANPLYIGKVRHKDKVYDGEHEPLVSIDLFDAVQKQLALGAPVPKGTTMHQDTHLLTGILFDDVGDRMSPTHGRAHGKRYRYYVSGRVRRSPEPVPDSWRIPAREIETIVRQQAIRILQDRGMVAGWVEKYSSSALIELGLRQTDGLIQSLSEEELADHLRPMLNLMFRSITLSTSAIRFVVKAAEIVHRLVEDSLDTDQHNGLADAAWEEGASDHDDCVIVELPIILRRRGIGMRIVIDSPYAQPEPDPSLVNLITSAHIYLEKLVGPSAMNITTIASTQGVDRADVGRILPLAFLGPKMLDVILTGQQSASLTARHLARVDLPILWVDQDAALQ